jgi:hypothetical protein
MQWSSRVEPFCARRVRRYLRECDVIRYQLSETDKTEFVMPRGSDQPLLRGFDPAAKVISDGRIGKDYMSTPFAGRVELSTRLG